MANLLLGSSVHEIDSFITLAQQILSIYSQSDTIRLHFALCLAVALFERHSLSNQREDLEKAIFRLTKLILFPPCSWLEHGPLILQALSFLAFALLERSKVYKQPEDAIHAAKYFRHLRGQPHQIVWLPRHRVTTLLVDALALQVKLEAGNVMQNIEAMADLCRELLTPETSYVDTATSLSLFTGAVLSSIHPWVPDQPLDQVIECLRMAEKHKPDMPWVRYTLAMCLSIRYFMTFANDDYEEAASIFDKIITSSSPGDTQDQIVAQVQQFITMLAIVRSKVHETPEYSEEATYRARAFLASGSSTVGHPLQVQVDFLAKYSLEDINKRRSRFFEGLEASPDNTALAQVMGKYGYDDSEFGRLHRKMEVLQKLISDIPNNDITKFDEAIEKGRTILATSGPGDMLAAWLFATFGTILFEAFLRTNKIEYLNESITTHRQVFGCPLAQYWRFTTLAQLHMSLLTRSRFFPCHRTQDSDEAMELLSQCVNDGHESFPNRLLFACEWASIARRIRHPSVSIAYESAMSLMQEALLFAPTLHLQHATLTMSGYDSHSMPLDYASYQVDLGQFEEAIETLERGRALLWSEMRHLRASIDRLLEADSQLGHKFAAVNRDLEELTKSISPSLKLSMDDGGASDLRAVRAVDPFGRHLLKQRSLLKERDNLISQIQALPGFDGFLTSPPFDTLRSAASSGPVIIINHSKWRSDILILLQNAPPSLIPTPPNFYDRASALKDKLLNSRHKYGPGSSLYDETLACVLAEFYKLVGGPVIDRLRQLQVPEQSRIWWCPTSVFCSLPLHAMGPISSDDGEKRYFLDLYICSYTPTLSALIQSRSNRDVVSRSSIRPSLLLVAQPDPSLPTVGGEIQVVEALDTEVTSLISEAATPAAVIDGFRHHQFVHFACHGTLEAGKPFEAGFELYGDERLTLLEIVRSHLPTAEFAFLSACHTAEVTEGSIVDEGLHLAAAVQYCGFRSVVGTMWAMVDEDGRDLAENFYKALLSTSRREQGILPYYERSAKALRFAVKKLRRKRRISLERWVNFVHYGA